MWRKEKIKGKASLFRKTILETLQCNTLYILQMDIIALFPGHKNYSLRHNFAEAGKKHRYIGMFLMFFHICSLGVELVFIGKISLLTVGMSEVRRWPIIGILDPIGIYHPDPQLQTNKRCKADRNR